MKKILVTGGAGFIGSNFIRFVLKNFEDVFIINLDALTYAGNLENLKEVESHPNYKFIRGKIQDYELIDNIFRKEDLYGVINFAAESHVDRSIYDARPFIETNVMGTLTLLDASIRFGIQRFLQISTDEVYGSLGSEGKFMESTPVDPKSPYSASKASADHLVMAYVNTFRLPALITRCSNNYGEYQFPEKLIPLTILNAIENKAIPVYGDGMNIRDWIYVQDHCRAIWQCFTLGNTGEIYNIGANTEKTNLELVKTILKILNKSEELITFVRDRPGHDRRYAIDSTKIRKELGWEPLTDFQKGLENTIEWYLNNQEWWQNVRNESYKQYYEKHYGTKL